MCVMVQNGRQQRQNQGESQQVQQQDDKDASDDLCGEEAAVLRRFPDGRHAFSPVRCRLSSTAGKKQREPWANLKEKLIICMQR